MLGILKKVAFSIFAGHKLEILKSNFLSASDISCEPMLASIVQLFQENLM